MDETIGIRWRETLDRIEVVENHPDWDDLSTVEHNILALMRDRLETYNDRAFISVSQLNALTRMEAKLNGTA